MWQKFLFILVPKHTFIQNYNILLSAGLFNVKSSTGNIIQCRVLIDTASQNSLISKNCVKCLNFPLLKYYSYVSRSK